MTTPRVLSLFLVTAMLPACSGNKEPGTTVASGHHAEPAAEEEQSSTKEWTGEPSTTEPSKTDQSQEPELRITRVSGSDTAPATSGDETTSVTVTAERNALVLTLENFVFYCSPSPTFSARIEGNIVVVQVEKPTEDVTRCIGPHSARLRLENVPVGRYDLSVRNLTGREVARTPLTVR